MSERDFSRPAEGGSENPGPDESSSDTLRGHGSENPGPSEGGATGASEAAADGQSERTGYRANDATENVQSGLTGKPGDPASDGGVQSRENPGPEEV